MALQVSSSFTTPEGSIVSSTYWRWVNLAIDVPAAQARAVLYGYISADAFNSNSREIGSKEYLLSGDDFNTFVLQPPPPGDTLSDQLSNVIYAYVKASDSFFANATDV